MGLRFHKTLKLLPGLRVNVNKGIPSLSIGGKGLTFNVNKDSGKTTAGLPGTGLFYSETTYGKKGKTAAILLLIVGVVVALAYNHFRQH